MRGIQLLQILQQFSRKEKEFDFYRAKEMKWLESDFDRAMKKLTDGSNS